MDLLYKLIHFSEWLNELRTYATPVSIVNRFNRDGINFLKKTLFPKKNKWIEMFEPEKTSLYGLKWQ